MATALTPAPVQRIGGGPTRSVAAASWIALGALLLRHHPGPRGGRHLGHVPGRAVDRAGHGPGVRLHPGDRGPGAGALPDLAGGGGQSAVRRGPGGDLGHHRAADGVGGVRPGRAAQHRPDVRLHHPADHVPGRHVLLVDQARAGGGGRLALAADAGADQPADLRERGDAGRVHRGAAPAPVPTRWCWASARCSWPSGCATSAAACCPSCPRRARRPAPGPGRARPRAGGRPRGRAACRRRCPGRP